MTYKSVEEWREEKKIIKENTERMKEWFYKENDKLEDIEKGTYKTDKIKKKLIKEQKKKIKDIVSAAKAQKIDVGDHIDRFRRMQMKGDLIGGRATPSKSKKNKSSSSKKRRIRKHKGINQTTGRLKKGYKYSGKKLKSGLKEIVAIKKKKNL